MHCQLPGCKVREILPPLTPARPSLPAGLCAAGPLAAPAPALISGAQLPWVPLLWLQPALHSGGDREKSPAAHGYVWGKHGVSRDIHSCVKSHSGAPTSGRLSFL